MAPAGQTQTPPGVRSLWLEGGTRAVRPPLTDDAQADVCVIGGGIAGISAAHELCRDGASVILLEQGRIGFGVTGHTTAKLSALQGLKYEALTRRFGRETAAAYAQANREGIDRIESVAAELEIDCDLRRKPAYTYTEDESQIPKIEAEVGAAAAAGLPVTYAEQTDLPFPILAAVCCKDQAEFHPVKYVQAVAEWLEANGAGVHEQTMATGVAGDRVATDGGAGVRADHVIVTTHAPFLDRGLFFARLHPERSYSLGIRPKDPPPQGMYLSAESPSRSIRSHPVGGDEMLIVGGESHKAGQGDAAEHYANLERYARERFAPTGIEYRWAAHDHMSPDGLPMIGRLWPASRRLLCATGMGKWGLAMGATAGRILADAAGGTANVWSEGFDPARISLSSVPVIAKENANAGWRFFSDRLTKRGSPADLGPGHGRVVGSGLRQTAVYRDQEGLLHELSARCTHLGCIVNWNDAEATWDCPCHGSRFGPLGDVIAGPATSPLPPQHRSFPGDGRGSG